MNPFEFYITPQNPNIYMYSLESEWVTEYRLIESDSEGPASVERDDLLIENFQRGGSFPPNDWRGIDFTLLSPEYREQIEYDLELYNG